MTRHSLAALIIRIYIDGSNHSQKECLEHDGWIHNMSLLQFFMLKAINTMVEGLNRRSVSCLLGPASTAGMCPSGLPCQVDRRGEPAHWTGSG